MKSQVLPGWVGARHWLSVLQEWLRPRRPVSVSSVIITARSQLGYSFLSASWKSRTITFFWRIWNIITATMIQHFCKAAGIILYIHKEWNCLFKIWFMELHSFPVPPIVMIIAMQYFMLMFVYAFLLIIHYSTRCVVNHFSILISNNSQGKY